MWRRSTSTHIKYTCTMYIYTHTHKDTPTHTLAHQHTPHQNHIPNGCHWACGFQVKDHHGCIKIVHSWEQLREEHRTTPYRHHTHALCTWIGLHHVHEERKEGMVELMMQGNDRAWESERERKSESEKECGQQKKKVLKNEWINFIFINTNNNNNNNNKCRMNWRHRNTRS